MSSLARFRSRAVNRQLPLSEVNVFHTKIEQLAAAHAGI